MTTRTRNAEAKRTAAEIEMIVRYADDDRDMLEGPELPKHLAGIVEPAELARMFLHARVQRDDLMKVLQGLKQSRQLAWVLSRPFAGGSNGATRSFLHATPVGGSSPGLFSVVDGELLESAPAVPHLGWVTRADPPIYLGPAEGIPMPPFAAEIREVLSVPSERTCPELAEIEIAMEGDQRRVLIAPAEVAAAVETKLEEGEAVTVRTDGFLAIACHDSAEREHEPWLEFLPEGPGIESLILPRRLREGFDRDIRLMAKGRGIILELVGTTGTGKTAAVTRFGQSVERLRREQGDATKGLALITLTAGTLGSSYIYALSRNLARALRRAATLAKRGFTVVVLLDEVDGIFGEAAGGGYEHAYSREARLSLQTELSNEMEGVGIILTRNPRISSWVSAALSRRCRTRVFGRPSRSQIAQVAGRYVTKSALVALGIGRREFGAVVADALFADDRIVAIARNHSGAKTPIRVRDLHTTSPGSVKSLVESYAEDLEDGEVNTMDGLLHRIDEEFVSADLNPQNLFDLTFLARPENDSVRSVELVR